MTRETWSRTAWNHCWPRPTDVGLVTLILSLGGYLVVSLVDLNKGAQV